jgi:hypothetical protein
MAAMNTVRSMFAGAALLALPAEAQEHRFEDDPVVMVRENFVACDVLSQLQRVIDNPRFLLAGECDPVRAGDRVRVYARRGPYVCIYPHDTVSPCKWTHEKALAKQTFPAASSWDRRPPLAADRSRGFWATFICDALEMVPFLRDGWQFIPETWVTQSGLLQGEQNALEGV